MKDPFPRFSRPRWLVSQGLVTLALSMIVLGGVMAPDVFDGWDLLGLAASSYTFVFNLIILRQWRRNQGRGDE